MGKVLFMRKGETHTPPKVGLPFGYTKLAYIQSSGTQYINSGFIANQDTRIVIDVMCPINTASTSKFLCGSRNPSSDNQFSLATNNGYYRTDYDGTRTNITNVPYNARFYIDKNKNVTDLNGDYTVTQPKSTFTTTKYPLYIFGVDETGSFIYGISMKLYSCQIYDNGTLVRDFIPCINPSGEVGLYDLVGKQFYGNSGTGTFGAGDVVEYQLPDGYEELAYIQSSGGPYIDSGVPYNENNEYVIETECKFLEDVTRYSGWNAGGLFGSVGNLFSNGSSQVSISSREFSVLKLTIQAGTSSKTILDVTQNGATQSCERTHPSIKSHATLNYPIFAYTNNSGGIMEGDFPSMACKWMTIKVNGKLVRVYKPCIANDGEVGLFDLITRAFFGNVNTTAGIRPFTGSEVA